MGIQYEIVSFGVTPTGNQRERTATLVPEDRVPCPLARRPGRPLGADHTDVVPKPPAERESAADGGKVTMDPDRVVAQNLRKAGIAPAATYSTGQVARIIGVSPETVRRLVDAYEPPAVQAGTDNRRGPSGLRAIRIITHRRIPHDALVDWLRENAAYLRLHHEAD